jgi:hypothetical protein
VSPASASIRQSNRTHQVVKLIVHSAGVDKDRTASKRPVLFTLSVDKKVMMNA